MANLTKFSAWVIILITFPGKAGATRPDRDKQGRKYAPTAAQKSAPPSGRATRRAPRSRESARTSLPDVLSLQGPFSTMARRTPLSAASKQKASRMVTRSFRMQQSQRMPDPPQRFLTGHFPLSCFLLYRKRLILCVGVFSKPSWFSTTTEMREKRFTLELT